MHIKENTTSVKFFESTLLSATAQYFQLELAHLVAKELQDLGLLNVQNLTLPADKNVSQQFYFLEVELGRQT